MRWLPMALLLAVTAGCWQPRYFAPRENRNGTGPDGEAAASYDIKVDGHDGTKGELRVWSSGATAHFTDDDQEVVDLRVGFELENNGAAPLELDTASMRCEELMVDGKLQEPLAPHQVLGSGFVTPGTTTRVDVVFRPATTRPRDIDGFAVRFALRDDQGGEVTQSTPFAPAVRQWRNGGWGWYGSFGWYGVYGPYGAWGPYGGWGPYSGWGWGFGPGLGYWGYRCR